jgi:hypothetical protein
MNSYQIVPIVFSNSVLKRLFLFERVNEEHNINFHVVLLEVQKLASISARIFQLSGIYFQEER